MYACSTGDVAAISFAQWVESTCSSIVTIRSVVALPAHGIGASSGGDVDAPMAVQYRSVTHDRS